MTWHGRSMARADAVKLAVVYRSLDGIQPYERNARRHTVGQIAAIKRSLAEFGWTAPMLLGDNQLVAGHARHRAASELATEGIVIPGCPPGQGPTIDLSHLPPEKRRAYVLADNRLAELSSWDTDLLAAELSDLSAEGFDTTVIGYSGEELTTLLQGWNTDFSEINRLTAEASDQLGVVVVRCRRDQLDAVTALFTQALAAAGADFANVTVGK
jgi:hypothetical protein